VIIFDASYLVVMFHPNPAPAKDRTDKPVSQFKERVTHLASKLDVSNDVIGIPTPAMAEVLVRAGNANARAGYVTTLSDTWKFQILPFDSRAAIEAAELIAKIKAEHKSQPWDTWAKVKFDVQISAIAKAESATVIYSDDQDIENHGKRLKIPVIRICDLPLPPPEEETQIETGPIGSQGALPLAPAEHAAGSTTPPAAVETDAAIGEEEPPATIPAEDSRGRTAEENNRKGDKKTDE
jgi:predicted nucleic acid-binding protein